MNTRRHLLCLIAGIALLPAQEPTVQITGAVKQPLTLTSSDLGKLPRASVSATLHGVESVYQGVWLHEIPKKAGVPLGKDLRGKALATYVLAEAQDGYSVLFSIAELDPEFIDNQILLADTAGGKPLSGEQ